MTAINNLLFSIQNQSPALLQVGGGRSENYQNLSSLAESLWGNGQWPASTGSSSVDKVSLVYQNISQKVVADLAALTAGAIRNDPSLDNDYFIALLDSGGGLEARVYRRSEILAAFEGSAEGEKALEAQLAASSLQVFTNASNLPAASSDPTCRDLAAQMNSFLKTNFKTLDTLKKAGFDPFLNLTAGEAIGKALAAYKAAAS